MSRSHALAIFRAALKAADPVQAVRQHVQLRKRVLRVGDKRYLLDHFDRIQVIGAGKASARMALALEKILGRRIDGGWVNVPEGHAVPLRRVHLHTAGHPIPDQRSVEGARRIAEIAKGAGKRDLLLCVISGGASALMALPAAGVTLARKKAVTKKLMASGAGIHEMNSVRKHLSAIKGGHLAELVYPATLVTLILSDVIGDDLDTIGSGPTVPDRSTCSDVERILRERGIGPLRLTETPKAGAVAFRNVKNVIVGSNRQSIFAAAQKARALGYEAIVLSTTIDGETRDVARMHAAIVREGLSFGVRKVCFLSGGETTVTIRGEGKGGRNQEFVLAALDALGQTRGKDVTIFSAGTDGIDGPTDAAGAVWTTSRKPGLDPRAFLAANDSYHFFENEGGLVKTGPTGTNVMDVRMLLL
ncbi:MAG: glycerate kinase [Bryobacteraceae bacterium]